MAIYSMYIYMYTTTEIVCIITQGTLRDTNGVVAAVASKPYNSGSVFQSLRVCRVYLTWKR